MTRMRLILALAGVLAVATPAASAEAQGRGRGNDVPPAYRPPAGMCRIWLDNVPAAQQPAPTDCTSAVRNRPSNGRVIFGDEPKDKSRRFQPKAPETRDEPRDRRPDDEGKKPKEKRARKPND